MLCDLVAPGAVVGGLTPADGRADGPAGRSAGGVAPAATSNARRSAWACWRRGMRWSNTGTGSYIIGHADVPALDEQMRVSCNVSAVPGAYIVEAAMLTSGAVHRWFRSSLRPGRRRPCRHGATGPSRPQQAPAGCNGLLLLPHFKGAGLAALGPAARAAVCNLSLSTTRGEWLRAILEGIAIELKEGLDAVEQLCGPVAIGHVSGGMTRSALFNQIQCDVLERPLLRFGGNEATSHGAWIAGAVATGLAASHAAAFARLSAARAARPLANPTRPPATCTAASGALRAPSTTRWRRPTLRATLRMTTSRRRT